MYLNNRFDKTDINRYWWDFNYCGICGSNNLVSVHHIDGCKKKYHSSLFNSIPLCFECHKKADGFNCMGAGGEEKRLKMTEYTLIHLLQQNKPITELDKEYLESIKGRVDNIKNKLK